MKSIKIRIDIIKGIIFFVIIELVMILLLAILINLIGGDVDKLESSAGDLVLFIFCILREVKLEFIE